MVTDFPAAPKDKFSGNVASNGLCH